MSQSPLKPTIGRAVHYHRGQTATPESIPHAATIAYVLDDTGRVNLSFVLHSGEMASAQDVPFSPEPKADHWNWAPRV